MAIQVNFACNDDHGNFTGKAVMVDFDPITCSIEGPIYEPDQGIPLAFSGYSDEDKAILSSTKIGERFADGALQVGGFKCSYFAHRSHTGNILWDTFWIAGVDAIALMNYIMTQDGWHCTEAESYLFECFDKKTPIIPAEYFRRRDAEALP